VTGPSDQAGDAVFLALSRALGRRPWPGHLAAPVGRSTAASPVARAHCPDHLAHRTAGRRPGPVVGRTSPTSGRDATLLREHDTVASDRRKEWSP
jgi:hypothetical protein